MLVFCGTKNINGRGPFSIVGWARSQSIKENFTYVTSSLIAETILIYIRNEDGKC